MMILEKVFIIVMNAKYVEKEKERILYTVKLVMHVLVKTLIINVKKIYLIKIVSFVWKICFIQENKLLN